MSEIRRCTRCVMDNAGDSTITFDENGTCNYCRNAAAKMPFVYFPNDEGKKKLESMLHQLREDGKGRDYDCMMGLSGGLDSSYLAYLGHQWGLRIYGVHIDDGFDTDISKQNLQKLSQACGIDLQIVKPDPEQYYALCKAYMLAGVPNLAVPQDNILFAALFKEMKKHKVKWFLSGGNFALECVLQRGNTHSAMDLTNIRDIARRFDPQPIDKLPFLNELQRNLIPYSTMLPLNTIDYNRERAFSELERFCGFQYYGRKHLENEFTAFLQLKWLPEKFGVDKRKSHLSSMIVSGQMTREEALCELSEPICPDGLMETYIADIKQKLHISNSEFDAIMAAPTHAHTEYAVSPYLRLKGLIHHLIGR